MPFVAESADNGPIAPPEAEAGETYTCPECDGDLSIRSSHPRGNIFVSRHFYHLGGDGGSCGGESDQHRRMKAVAYSKAADRWPDATVSYEEPVGDRQADVLVEFVERHPNYGDGVAIECQYRNGGKDYDATEHTYADNGYSTLWLEEEHFERKDVDLDAGDWRLGWPLATPSTDEWTGYHGVVRWLQQDKDAPVELEIPFPEECIEDLFSIEWTRGHIWYNRRYNADEGRVHVYGPSPADEDELPDCPECERYLLPEIGGFECPDPYCSGWLPHQDVDGSVDNYAEKIGIAEEEDEDEESDTHPGLICSVCKTDLKRREGEWRCPNPDCTNPRDRDRKDQIHQDTPRQGFIPTVDGVCEEGEHRIESQRCARCGTSTQSLVDWHGHTLG
ncbi:competence protein CoiA family protein [Halarchaeum acidiphilum]|uniref:hypothetical protein n=1 Tax=Halarchaeum acidiphilum TaxID=489138 RepID=UPI000365640F|nr:hypothetical protein [Halarchaeum acidiphilum]